MLTNADNPAIRERREDMVETFMQDKLKGRLDNHYESNAAHTGDNISGVGNNAVGQMGTYQQYNQDIDGKVKDAGIQTNVKTTVLNNMNQTQDGMTSGKITFIMRRRMLIRSKPTGRMILPGPTKILVRSIMLLNCIKEIGIQ